MDIAACVRPGRGQLRGVFAAHAGHPVCCGNGSSRWLGHPGRRHPRRNSVSRVFFGAHQPDVEGFSPPAQRDRGMAPGAPRGRIWSARRNTKRCVAIAARPVALVSALLVVYALTIGGPRIKDIMLRFDSIAGAEGSAEPVAYTGLPQRGDLVFLRHEANGKVRFGVDFGVRPQPAVLLMAQSFTAIAPWPTSASSFAAQKFEVSGVYN